MILAFCGRGTNSQVLLSIRALYSSCIAFFQFGSLRAPMGFRGMGEMELVLTFKAWLLYFELGLKIPCWLRVVMRWLAVRGLLLWWGSVEEGRAGSGGTAVGVMEADCWAVGEEGKEVRKIGWWVTRERGGCNGEAAAGHATSGFSVGNYHHPKNHMR